MKTIELTIDKTVLDRYSEYYFQQHPKAKNKPIPLPYHPSLNEWIRLRRFIMNGLKQKWKDFVMWFVEEQGYSNLHIEKCEICFTTYYCTHRRHDVDNGVPKFILDGFVESGFIVDDDDKHLVKLVLQSDTDSDNPRTEILVTIKEK